MIVIKLPYMGPHKEQPAKHDRLPLIEINFSSLREEELREIELRLTVPDPAEVIDATTLDT